MAWHWIWIALALALAGCGAFAVAAGRSPMGVPLPSETPQDRAERLATEWRIVDAPGAGGAILLSGCDGVRDNMDYWARVFAGRGRSSLIVDSHVPRRLNRLQNWRLVCTGLALPGAERAGDIAVALADGPDAGRGTIIFGASHGGWAALEFVGLAAQNQVPPGLSAWPRPPGELLDQVTALVLLYPYCGALNTADQAPWNAAPPVLMVLAEDDSIVSAQTCANFAERLRARGGDVEIVVLPGADHGFDQAQKAVFSTLAFDPGLRAEARDAVERFLDARGL